MTTAEPTEEQDFELSESLATIHADATIALKTWSLPDGSEVDWEGFLAWLDEDPPETPLDSFDLSTAAGREGFLHEFYWWGADRQFKAVSYLWASLNEPRGLRGTLIGAAAETGGIGKTAIRRTLLRFLEEALAADDNFPEGSDFATFGEWNDAAVASFSSGEDAVWQVVRRYAKLINGELPDATANATNVLFGPWLGSEPPE